MRLIAMFLSVCGACGWASQSRVTARVLDDLPVTFERNQGQWPPGIELGAHIGGHEYTFAQKEIVVDGTIHIALISSTKGKTETLEPVQATTNYLRGRDSHKWVIGVPNYKRILRRNAFPGVDMILHGSHGQLEFDYVLAPGANPDSIRFRVGGASISASSDNLRLTMPTGDALELKAPVAYQETSGRRKAVACRFRTSDDGSVAFTTSSYDRSRPLIIDPVVSFLGSPFVPYQYDGNPPAVTSDPEGNFYFAGTTNGPWTFDAGTFRAKSNCRRDQPYFFCYDAWLAKFSPNENRILWSTFIGGFADTTNEIYSIAVDHSGNVVLGGYGSPDFPVTPDAYLSKYPSTGLRGFLTKLSPSGTSVVYSTFLDDYAPSAIKVGSDGAIYFKTAAHIAKLSVDGSSMVYRLSTSVNVYQIEPDSNGNLYTVGLRSPDFPVTPGAYAWSDNDGFSILKFDPHGELVFSASFPGQGPVVPSDLGPYDVKVDSSGNIVFTGAGAGVPVINDREPQSYDCDQAHPCAYIAALDSTGSVLLYSRLLGHGRGEGLAFGSNGEVYVAGNAYGGYFPRTVDAFQYCSGPTTSPSSYTGAPNGFLIELDSQGRSIFSSYLPTGGTTVGHLRLGLDGKLYFGGRFGGYIATTVPHVAASYFAGIIDTGQAPHSPHACLVNATQNVPDWDGLFDFYVAPGEIVTLFGEGLGPEQPASAEWTPEGSVSTTLAGVQVLFDGIPAPMLYAQANQINCIIPFAVETNKPITVVVKYGGNQTEPLPVRVAPVVLNLFTKEYAPLSDVIAINEDGSMNSADHPAPRGSIVTFFATGGGETDPPLYDGQIAEGPAIIRKPLVGFTDRGSGTRFGEIEYAGAAPGQVAGVYQLNVKIPSGATPGHVQVQIGNLLNAETNIAFYGIWLK